VFDKIMPPGVPPLSLFTTLARVPRVYDKFRAGGLLDRGPVSMRHREIVIDRTCARCGCAYEWGVHVAFFAERVGLTPDQVRATVRGGGDDPAWTDEERLLVGLSTSCTRPPASPTGSGMPSPRRSAWSRSWS
jgi:alkylhydroperoxidase family enzyme